MIASYNGKEPNIFNEAFTSSGRDLWMKVTEEEMESMKVN